MKYVLYEDPKTGENCWRAVHYMSDAAKILQELARDPHFKPDSVRITCDSSSSDYKCKIQITVPLSPELFDLIRYVKSIIDMSQKETMLLRTIKKHHKQVTIKGNEDWDSLAFQRFMSIDETIFTILGISQSRKTFNAILEFPVTEEMLCAEEDELNKFASPFKKIMEVG